MCVNEIVRETARERVGVRARRLGTVNTDTHTHTYPHAHTHMHAVGMLIS